MKCYLVEVYDPSMNFDDDGYEVVALTPMACYELDKAGIKHSILEDYYDEAEFLRGEEAYYKDQLGWFDKLDKFLFDVFPEAGIRGFRLASNYHFYIKSTVDSIVMRCKEVDRFINNANPDSIIYISPSGNEDVMPSNKQALIFRGGQSLLSLLVSMFCEKYKIDFERKIVSKTATADGVSRGHGNRVNRIREGLNGMKYTRGLYTFYKTGGIAAMHPKSCPGSKWNMLFLKTPGFVKTIMKEARREGHGVYYRRDNAIVKCSAPYYKVAERIDPNAVPALSRNKNDVRKKMEQSDIVSWVSSYCGIDVSAILLPRLAWFINELCPQLVSLVGSYIAFYKDRKIDMVVTPHMVSVDEHAAIMAARYAEKTTSICLQHGDSAFALKMWDCGECSPYDVYLATNDEQESYFKRRMQIANINTDLAQYPNRWEMIPRSGRAKWRQRRHAISKTVVYVPTMYQWDNTFWNEARVPDAWYFSWHKELLKLFSSRKEFDFIWKGIPASNETYDPIPNLINDQGYRNIRYATEPFTKWIKKADLVLLDYPSTALYEAAVSGLPVMSLFFAPFNVVRETALGLFGNSLQPFSNFHEGIAKIDDFLEANPDAFVVSIPRSQTSILQAIRSFGAK